MHQLETSDLCLIVFSEYSLLCTYQLRTNGKTTAARLYNRRCDFKANSSHHNLNTTTSTARFKTIKFPQAGCLAYNFPINHLDQLA